MKAATTLVLFAAGVLASPAYIRSPLATRQTSCKDILDQALGADSKLTEGLRKEFCNDDPDLTLGKSVTDAIDEFCAGQDVKQIACGQGTSPSPPAKPTPEPGSTTCKEILDQALGADSKETESLRQEFCNDDPDFTLGQSVKDAIDEFCVGQDVKQVACGSSSGGGASKGSAPTKGATKGGAAPRADSGAGKDAAPSKGATKGGAAPSTDADAGKDAAPSKGATKGGAAPSTDADAGKDAAPSKGATKGGAAPSTDADAGKDAAPSKGATKGGAGSPKGDDAISDDKGGVAPPSKGGEASKGSAPTNGTTPTKSTTPSKGGKDSEADE